LEESRYELYRLLHDDFQRKEGAVGPQFAATQILVVLNEYDCGAESVLTLGECSAFFCGDMTECGGTSSVRVSTLVQRHLPLRSEITISQFLLGNYNYYIGKEEYQQVIAALRHPIEFVALNVKHAGSVRRLAQNAAALASLEFPGPFEVSSSQPV
jgi:hypothetical protein